MKTLLSLFSFFICSISIAQQLEISGRVTNVNNPENHNIQLSVSTGNQLVYSTKCDKFGFYKINISSGIYDFRFYINGFDTVLLKNIDINKTGISINFKLSFSSALKFQESRISDTSFMFRDSTSDYFSDEALIPAMSGVISTTKSISGRGSRDRADASVAYEVKTSAPKATDKKATEKKVTSPTWGFSEKVALKKEDARDLMDAEGKEGDSDIPDAVKPVSEIRAGQITAGHWRDLDHWVEWINTNLPITISSLMKVWGIYPHTQYRLILADNNGKALRDVKAVLKSADGTELWWCISDAKGRCYFWVDLFNPKEPLSEFILEAEGAQFRLKRADFNTDTPIKINSSAPQSRKIEIGFMVDATGSMADEIKYLQVEIIDVISRIKKARPCSEILSGSVFYKDYGDDYVTKVMPLKSNPEYNISFIGEQSASGGGDFPEAVEEGLSVAIDDLGWSETPSTKILFMILDAPPHSNNEEHKAKVRQYIELAAKKGIRLVPVASSGIDIATEFLLKYMAIATNGEYIYITDDSHIGDSHLKPTGGESKVEYLNDLMVKLILDYSDINCSKPAEVIKNDTFRTQVLTQAQIDSIKRQETNIEINGSDGLYMKFYPNPAKDILLVEFSETFEHLIITDLNGRELYSSSTSGQTQISMNISSWNSGLYMVYVQKGDKRLTGKLLVMH